MDNESRENFDMDTISEIVAKNVQARMEANPSANTQSKLAKRAGISQSHVSRLLNEGASVTIGRLAKVATALGCEPYELLIDDDQARRSLIERLMRGPAVPTERVEQAGFVSMPNHDDGHPDELDSAPPERRKRPRKSPPTKTR